MGNDDNGDRAWCLCNKHMRLVCGRVSQLALRQTEIMLLRILGFSLLLSIDTKRILIDSGE